MELLKTGVIRLIIRHWYIALQLCRSSIKHTRLTENDGRPPCLNAGSIFLYPVLFSFFSSLCSLPRGESGSGDSRQPRLDEYQRILLWGNVASLPHQRGKSSGYWEVESSTSTLRPRPSLQANRHLGVWLKEIHQCLCTSLWSFLRECR